MDLPQDQSMNPYSEHRFKIADMSCASCVITIENAVKVINGVSEVNVNFGNRIATVKIENTKSDMALPFVIEAIKQVGYAPIELKEANEKLPHDIEMAYYHRLLRQSITALIAGVLLMGLSFLNWLPPLNLPAGQTIGILVGTLSLVVLIYTALDIYRGAYKAFRMHIANMDTLVALGTATAWLFSMIVVLFPLWFTENTRHIYFESALIIIAFIKLGAALEIRSRGKTRLAVERLLHLQPTVARVIRHDEEWDLPLHEVIIGDILHVRPGERVPVDGVITQGYSSVDESMFTGEFMPVDKNENDAVIGGTLNKTGSFQYRATHVGKDMALAQIVDMVTRAQNAKLPIARVADHIAAYFVPLVLAFAVCSALAWFNYGPEPKWTFMIVVFTNVLLIACPCAIGLATPLAVMAGVGRAVKSGILIRNGAAFGNSAAITTIVFDKTGTITQGKPSLTEVYPHKGWSVHQLIQYAATLERNSEHPLAEAILQTAKKENLGFLPIERFHAIPGYGLSGIVNGKIVLLGNAKLMRERNIQLDDLNNIDGAFNHAAGMHIEQALEKGCTVLYIAIDNQAAGALAVADTLKPDAQQAIATLQRMGFKIIMLSGDHEKTAQAIAQQVNITQVYAGVLPQEKMHKIADLKMQGEKVAMVGDGINDAPALAEADVGFAVGTATDVAIESGDIVLMRDSLYAVVDAIILSRATNRNIKENLFGALIYNILSIPIAAGILYPSLHILLNPMIAGVAMALSSLTVVCNASRLSDMQWAERGDH